MKALEVRVNGKMLCIAGSGREEHTFVNLEMTDMGDGQVPLAGLCVSGSRKEMVVMWQENFYPLQTGDEVTIRIVDVASADPPVASTPAWTTFPDVEIG